MDPIVRSDSSLDPPDAVSAEAVPSPVTVPLADSESETSDGDDALDARLRAADGHALAALDSVLDVEGGRREILDGDAERVAPSDAVPAAGAAAAANEASGVHRGQPSAELPEGAAARIAGRGPDVTAEDGVLIEDLVGMLDDVKTHIYRDHGRNPKLNSVLGGMLLESRAGELSAVATDGSTLACARRPASGLGEWKLLLRRSAVVALLDVAKTARARDGYLAYDTNTGRLSVRFGPHTLIPRTEDGKGFVSKVPWRERLITALGAEPVRTTDTHVAAAMLGRVPRRPDAAALVLWGTGPAQPIVVASGTEFIALVMPLGASTPTGDTTAADSIRAAWSAIPARDR